MEPQSAQFGQQGGHHQGGQQSITVSNTIPDYQWNALTNVAQAVAICEYCKSQCVIEADPNMIECIRLCEDVAELGKATLSLVPQESRFQDQLISTFEQAVQSCAQECGQHEHAHCQQCAQVLNQTVDAIAQLRQGGQGMGDQGMSGQQGQFGQQGQSGQAQSGQGGQAQGQTGQFQEPQQFGGGQSQGGQEQYGQRHF